LALAQRAVGAKTESQRQKAAVALSDAGPEAVVHLRRLLHESRDASVRAVCAQGLANLYDYDSVDLLIEALQDDSPGDRGKLVRMRAAAALSRLWLRDLHFPAAAPPAERRQAVDRIRKMWRDMTNPSVIENLKKSDSYQGPWAELAGRKVPGKGTASPLPTKTEAGKD
jgi:hypothetical protein